MDYVLDTLLQALLKLVSLWTRRAFLLVEADTVFFLAREVQNVRNESPVFEIPRQFEHASGLLSFAFKSCRGFRNTGDSFRTSGPPRARKRRV